MPSGHTRPPSSTAGRRTSRTAVAENAENPTLNSTVDCLKIVDTFRRVVVVDESHEGSRPDASYHDRFGYRQERVSGPRHRRQGEGGCEKATSAQPSDSVFQGFAAVPDRNGGVCHRALLGARVEKARPQGAADAG